MIQRHLYDCYEMGEAGILLVWLLCGEKNCDIIGALSIRECFD